MIRERTAYRNSAPTHDEPSRKIISFLAPDAITDDPHHNCFEITIPHVGRGSIRMEPFSYHVRDSKAVSRRFDLATVANGLMENKGFFIANVHHDGEERDVYVPAGMGQTLSNRLQSEDYIFIPTRPHGGGTLLSLLLDSGGTYGGLDWLFNVILTRAEIVAKLGFNRDDKSPAPDEDKWITFAGNMYQGAIDYDERRHPDRHSGSGTPIEQVWGIAKMRLPQGDAWDLLTTPISTLALYSGLLK